MADLNKNINENDVLIFYFSGHGYSIGTDHYLVFSDGFLRTQQLIEYFEVVKAKTKIIFLDCCFSGNFKLKGTSSLDIEKTVSEFYSKGYVVFASSNTNQKSYPHPTYSISLFTFFLCAALQSKFLISEGKISLYDITRLVSLYLELWNKKNPDEKQKPIFRAKIGATIYFEVDE